MAFQFVATTDEVPDHGCKLIPYRKHEIGLFHENGAYYAVLNYCPHAGAPICRGEVEAPLTASADGTYTVETDRPVLRCPWHHWEFELKTGAPVCDIKQKLKTFEVVVEGNNILLDL